MHCCKYSTQPQCESATDDFERMCENKSKNFVSHGMEVKSDREFETEDIEVNKFSSNQSLKQIQGLPLILSKRPICVNVMLT